MALRVFSMKARVDENTLKKEAGNVSLLQYKSYILFCSNFTCTYMHTVLRFFYIRTGWALLRTRCSWQVINVFITRRMFRSRALIPNLSFCLCMFASHRQRTHEIRLRKWFCLPRTVTTVNCRCKTQVPTTNATTGSCCVGDCLLSHWSLLQRKTYNERYARWPIDSAFIRHFDRMHHTRAGFRISLYRVEEPWQRQCASRERRGISSTEWDWSGGKYHFKWTCMTASL